MRTFSHLTQEERYHIYIMQKKKISLGKIAKGMGRDKSTMSRELRRSPLWVSLSASPYQGSTARY
jgi:IS30 family transposase